MDMSFFKVYLGQKEIGKITFDPFTTTLCHLTAISINVSHIRLTRLVDKSLCHVGRFVRWDFRWLTPSMPQKPQALNSSSTFFL